MPPRSVCAIVPALNAQDTIARCLRAILNQTRRPTEVIVFDDGSRDDTGVIALAEGAKILRNDGSPRGPAFGRNQAAAATDAEMLLFVDADVILRRDAVERLIEELEKSHASAAFGSYDDDPSSRRVASLYVNLRHHYTHQLTGAANAETFWAGIGLVSRQAFINVGGFDSRRYPVPSVEDIELGTRLVNAGHQIRLTPNSQGQHCKDWTAAQVWRTDIFKRAYPWSCLIADGRSAGTSLNLTGASRVAFVSASIGVACVALTPVLPAMGAFALGALAVYVFVNLDFFRLLARKMSPRRTLQAMGMHFLYHLYAGATFGGVLLATRLGLRRRFTATPRVGRRISVA